MANHKYTVEEVQSMRAISYQLAIEMVGKIETKDKANLYMNHLQFGETLLQTFIAANLTYEDLEKEYAILMTKDDLQRQKLT